VISSTSVFWCATLPHFTRCASSLWRLGRLRWAESLFPTMFRHRLDRLHSVPALETPPAPRTAAMGPCSNSRQRARGTTLQDRDCLLAMIVGRIPLHRVNSPPGICGVDASCALTNMGSPVLMPRKASRQSRGVKLRPDACTHGALEYSSSPNRAQCVSESSPKTTRPSASAVATVTTTSLRCSSSRHEESSAVHIRHPDVGRRRP
jgi:hypothetical protein